MRFEWCPEGWRLVRLGDLGEVNRGRSRHRPRHDPVLYGGQYPFIQTGDVKASGGRITDHNQSYNDVGLAQSRLWPAGTMCITIAANIAETGILQFPSCFPDSIVGFIADPMKCDVYFIEYIFRYIRYQIQHGASGTVQDNINLGTLDRLRFPIPSLSEQQANAAVVGALDDKIELNRRMNRTLEAMARAIFKSWFVDFDPVVAKAEGRKPYGMDAATAALFPAALQDSNLGPVPEGWEVGSLREAIELIGGGTPKTSVPEYWDGDIPWFSVVDAPAEGDVFVIDTDRHVTQRGVDESSTRILPVGTTIISARGTVGKCALVGRPMAMNQSCYGIRGAIEGADLYTHFAVRYWVGDLERSGHGTVFNTITRDSFKVIQLPLPPLRLRSAYDSQVKPFLDRVLNGLHQLWSLSAARDALLPKLLSGEIRIKDAEKIVGDVA